MELIRLLAFMLSIYGYILVGNKRLKIDIEFLPAIIFSNIGCLIFLSGILNVMNISFWIIFLFGLCLDVYYLLRRDVKVKVSFGILFCVGLMVYLLFFLENTRYFHYDNFSHWGLVIKNIYINSRFPNFMDEIIQYQSYPVGSAGFVWYVCKIIGYSEGTTLFAQNLLTLSFASTLFVMCKAVSGSKKIFMSLMIAFECIVWLTYGAYHANGLYQLLVDILLAAIAVSAFTIVYYYKEDVSKAYFCVLPLVVFEICVKNSGIMWVFAILVELLYFSFQQKAGIKKMLCLTVGTVGVPIIFKILWDAHVDVVFVNGNDSSHAMTAEHWTQIFNGKTSEDIQNITQLFFEQVFTTKNTVLMLLIAMVLFTAFLFTQNKKAVAQSHLIFGVIFLFGVYVVYQMGNYVMYIFSMPVGEALALAGYARYIMTVDCFIVGVLSVYLLELLNLFSTEEKISKQYSFIAISLLLIGLLVSKSKYIKDIVVYEEPQAGRETARIRLDDIVDKYHLEDGKRCIVYVGDPNKDRDVGYRSYMSRYVLYSKSIKTVNNSDIYKLKDAYNYDYAIILEHDDAIDSWLADSSLPFENGECLKMEDYQYITLQDYLRKLKENADNYICFISVKDDASVAFTNEMLNAMRELGLKEDLSGKYRYGYGAVIDSGNVVYEKIGDELIEASGKCSGVNYSLKSGGFYHGNESSIVVNGEEYSKNQRGINIVVYDKDSQQVIDSVSFDTWQLEGMYVENK